MLSGFILFPIPFFFVFVFVFLVCAVIIIAPRPCPPSSLSYIYIYCISYGCSLWIQIYKLCRILGLLFILIFFSFLCVFVLLRAHTPTLFLGYRLWLELLREPPSLHVHPIALLQGARSHSGPALWTADRHVVARLYPSRTSSRLPSAARRR